MEQQGEKQFEQQMSELTKAFENLRKTTYSALTRINSQELIITEDDSPDKVKVKQQLDTEVEALHLAVSNLFGDCDKRKLKIEAAITQNVDISDFSTIANRLMTL